MSDARKFCWGTFAGIGVSCWAQNIGIWSAPTEVGDGVAILIVGLALGCTSIIMFGDRS